jgi:PKD repeat protein
MPSITAWYWDFGDGTTSTEQHPEHTFQNAGYYTVQHDQWDDEGNHDSTSILVFATGADINYDWAWDFGDGSVSDAADPEHIYTVPGLYTVELQVDGTTETKTDYVEVTSGASFDAPPAHHTAPLITSFDSGAPDSPLVTSLCSDSSLSRSSRLTSPLLSSFDAVSPLLSSSGKDVLL